MRITLNTYSHSHKAKGKLLLTFVKQREYRVVIKILQVCSEATNSSTRISAHVIHSPFHLSQWNGEEIHQGPILLTWFNFNPSMDK